MKNFVVLLFVVGITSLIFSCEDRDLNSYELYNYLPQLKKSHCLNLQFKKLNSDPSYTLPYVILISFNSDDPRVFSELNLKNRDSIDSKMFQSQSWVEEYRLYFTMSSVNAERITLLATEIEKISWWNTKDCSDTYAAPYLDQGSNKGVVLFGQKKNGRIAGCKKGNSYLILIECWG